MEREFEFMFFAIFIVITVLAVGSFTIYGLLKAFLSLHGMYMYLTIYCVWLAIGAVVAWEISRPVDKEDYDDVSEP